MKGDTNNLAAIGEYFDDIISSGRYDEFRERHDHEEYFSELPDNLSEEDLTEYMLKWLKDEDDVNRPRLALKELGRIKNLQTVKAIARMLKNEDWEIRNEAVKAISNFGEEGLKPAFRILGDREAFIHEDLSAFLLKYPDKTLTPLLKALNKNSDIERRQAAADCLCAFDNPKIIKPFLAIFKDKNEDEEIRQSAASALGQFADNDIKKLLIEVVENTKEKPNVRTGATQGLSRGQEKVYDEEVAKLLVAALKDEVDSIRQIALLALEPNEKNLPHFVNSLNDSSNSVRYSALQQMGKFKSKEALAPVIFHLRNEREGFNFSVAVQILINYGEAETVEPLLEALLLIRPTWRVDDTKILDYLLNFKDIALPLITRSIKEKRGWWRDAVLRHLGQRLVTLADSQGFPILEELKNTGSLRIQQFVEASLTRRVAESDN